jgi:hypothetical protein
VAVPRFFSLAKRIAGVGAVLLDPVLTYTVQGRHYTRSLAEADPTENDPRDITPETSMGPHLSQGLWHL